MTPDEIKELVLTTIRENLKVQIKVTPGIYDSSDYTLDVCLLLGEEKISNDYDYLDLS